MKTQRLFFVLAITALALIAACATSRDASGTKGNLTPGTYEAKASGYQTTGYTVSVTVDKTRIAAITYDGLNDSAFLGSAAVPVLIERMLADQTSGVRYQRGDDNQRRF
ncbi:MAG: hypothetical protein LBB98_12045 [Treponema sp.]|nr:hypothetical protein [Treponema sp.]